MLTLVDVALNHDTHNSGLASGDLLGKHSGNLWLVLVVLFRVTVAAVNHQARSHALGLKLGLSLLDAGSIVVRSLLAAAQDDEAIRVAHGSHDRDNTRLGHRQEVVRRLNRANGVNGNVKRAVGTVLETDGEGQTRGQLTVNLGLSGSGTDRTNGKTVGQELRGDGVKHLTGNGHSLVCQIHEELAGGAQTLVNLEAIVDIGIVDQALPADSCTWLLQVGAHDNKQIIGVLLLQLQQAITVLQSHIGIVNRAGSDDDHQTLLLRIGTVNDCNGLFTSLEDGLARFIGQCDLMLKEVGWSEGVVADNCAGWLRKVNWGVIGLYVLRESSRWLWLPTLGFSMKN